MKRIIYFYILAFFALIISCEKQVDIKTSFPFTVDSNYRETIVINTQTETSFDLTPDQVVFSNVYIMSYRVLSGEGTFFMSNGESLTEDEIIELDGLKLDGFFQPSVIGEIEVEYTFSDQQGEQHIETVNYISENNPFSVELNTISTSATVDESKNFSLIVSNTGDDDDVTYTAALYLSQGTGTIELLNDEGEVVYEVNQNETFEIEEGTYNYAVTLNDDGVNILKVDVTDSNDQELSDTIEFSVNVINYNFSGEPEAISTSLGNDLDLNFILNEIDGGNADYKLRYVFESGDANIFSGATQIFAGTNTDVNLGQFSWLFRPTDIGTVQMTFYAVNSTNVEKEINIEIEVSDRSFDFTATRALANVPIGQGIDINYVITEEGGNINDTYTMTYTTSNNGTLVINGQEYQPGTAIVINSLNFTATYFGSDTGEHILTSNIRATSNGLNIPKETELEFTASEFTLNVTSNVELSVNETLNVEFLIQETIGESDFDISYTISGPNQTIFNENNIEINSGTSYDVSTNTFIWTLEAIEQGQVTITYTVENQYGFKQSVPITYTINPLSFDFTISSSSSFNFTDEFETFSVNLSGQPSSLTYELSVQSTNTFLNGIQYRSAVYDENENFSISASNNSVGINSNDRGTNNLVFSVTASNGVTISKNLSISFLDKIFLSSVNYNEEFCGTFCRDVSLTVNFTKDISERLVSIVIDDVVYNVNTNTNQTSYTITYNWSRSCNRCDIVYTGDVFSSSEDSEIYLIDSNGVSSNVLIRN